MNRHKPCLDINNRIPGKNAAISSLLYALFNCRHVFPRNSSADNFIHKLKAFSRLKRLNLEIDMAILSASAALPDKLSFSLCSCPYRFFIGNLRLADICSYLKLPA